MNKATMQVYNINSQGSFCFSELLLKGSEQSYRQIGQSCCNRIYIILKLIRPHQRTAQSSVPLLRVARGLWAFWLSAPDHSICITPGSWNADPISPPENNSYFLSFLSTLFVKCIGMGIKWDPRKATAILSYLLYSYSYEREQITYILTSTEI